MSGTRRTSWTWDELYRGETVRVWLQQHGLDAVSDEIERRRLKLIAALDEWEKDARSTVLWNVNTIETFHEIPNSGGIQWPKSGKPELIDYLGDDFSDSLRDICSDVAELATYLKMQRAKVANQLAKVQQPIAPPAAPSSGAKPVETIMNDTLLGILKALDGRAMRVEKLAQEVTGGESSRLYRDGMKTVLVKDGHIVLDRRIGYYRPDKPPVDRVLPAAKLDAKK